MSKDNYDTETKQALSEADALSGMFKSSGWKIAEEALNDIIAELRDARNLPMVEDVADHLKVNLAVAENLEAWVDDLKGRVDNAIIMSDSKDSKDLITRR